MKLYQRVSWRHVYHWEVYGSRTNRGNKWCQRQRTYNMASDNTINYPIGMLEREKTLRST